MTPEDLFDGNPVGLAICQAVGGAISDLGEVDTRVTRSQVSFRRRRGFAYVWSPGQYVRSDVPAVLSIALPREIVSDRVKEVVHPSTRVWLHHLELRDPAEVDAEVRTWLSEGYDQAG